MKIADYVADWIASINPRVYAVCGAGAMHLNDAICHHPKLQVMAMHHEQAATFAAEADARISGTPGIVHVTAGPGGTNTLTGVSCAYVDSIPLIVVAGQVTTGTLKSKRLRQLGMNELPLPDMAGPVTKFAVTARGARGVASTLAHAAHCAQDGRKGPVFVEIPLDIQNAEFEPESTVEDYGNIISVVSDTAIRYVADEFARAQRPVLLIGNGIRLADAVKECGELVDALKIPVVSSWGGADIVSSAHSCYIGRSGIFGCRPANLTVQNADLILAIGTRLSIPQTGHARDIFAPNAKKIVVDISPIEANKNGLRADYHPIAADAKAFICALIAERVPRMQSHMVWLHRCIGWRDRYPVMCAEYGKEDLGVNSYFFAEQLAKHMPDDAIVVTDVGFSYICTFQSLPIKSGQRLIHSHGVSPMGWGLPAAIGACRAGGGRKTICLSGDGGMMLNLQELQTISHHQLPITIFVFCNDGYGTIRAMQDNHFGRHSIAGAESGLSCPSFGLLAAAFGIPHARVHTAEELEQWMEFYLERPNPFLVEVHLPRGQKIVPRVQSRIEKGAFVPTPLDDMWPYLDRRELEEHRA